jgi:tRNA pseudouridine38-40 synthase
MYDQIWRMRVAYHGGSFLGWQRQPQGLTVQEALETALKVALRRDIAVTAAGRTDTGVHARGQVVNFEAPADIEPWKVLRSLNGLLPKTVTVRDLEPAPEAFSARFSARFREYCYRVWLQPTPLSDGPGWLSPHRLDVDKLCEAISWFEGEHDFLSFCIPREDGKSTLCRIDLARAVPHPDGVLIWVRGDRFLHRMVRSVTGFCVDVARGKMSRDAFDVLINCGDAGPRMWLPPEGLTLERVGYDGWTEPKIRGQPDA